MSHPSPESAGPMPSLWTGPATLQLRNGRDWFVGEADLAVGRDTVHVRYANRCLAVMDRDCFRDWLLEVEPGPLAVDDVVWSVEAGSTWMADGNAMFRITADSLRALVGVI